MPPRLTILGLFLALVPLLPGCQLVSLPGQLIAFPAALASDAVSPGPEPRPPGTMPLFPKAEMEAEVLKHVPLGTPIDQARRIMEAHGFACNIEYGHYDFMYLSCHASQYCGSFVTRKVTVTMNFDDAGLLAGLMVHSGLTGF